ncbi:MAG: hypothetical protein EXR72_04570 [Myxococcales bacterium]|nr:hypothetical protein [Myxococcales bacterium]
MKRWTGRAAVAVMALLGAGCSETAERLSDRFVDSYFVEADQLRARPLTVGLAEKKLDDEQKLVVAVRRENADRAETRPTVFYQRQRVNVDGDRARATYDITIRFGGDVTEKNALLSLERTSGRWRVANFMVAEGHLPGPRPAGP